MPRMRRLSLLLLAPLAFAMPAPAHADSVCQYVAVDTGSGENEVANPCVGYEGAISCVTRTEPSPLVTVIVVVCVPEIQA